MSNFDGKWGVGYDRSVGRSTAAEVDQGLRAYMLGVYNYMSIGLAITGATALGVYMMAVTKAGGAMALTPFGQAIYTSPLRWVIMLSPLAFIFMFGARMGGMSVASARNMFFAFSAVMGLSMSSILLVFTGVSVARVFFITAAAFGGLSI